MNLYHISNPYFYFDCTHLVWYATQTAVGAYTPIAIRNGNVYR